MYAGVSGASGLATHAPPQIRAKPTEGFGPSPRSEERSFWASELRRVRPHAVVELDPAGPYDPLVTLRAGIHELGPDTASLVVQTYREGLAAKAGHDLIIDVRQWGATLKVGEDLSQSSLQLHADARSLFPREGLRGVKPLSDKDRDEVRKNIDEKVLGGEPISFRSSAVEAADDGRLKVRGELTIRGQSRPASFELSVGADGRVTGTAQLVQTEWGVKPYRGLMGALKVRDSVEVVFDGVLPND
jgi:polyisoprenoid-binding protein YceI